MIPSMTSTICNGAIEPIIQKNHLHSIKMEQKHLMPASLIGMITQIRGELHGQPRRSKDFRCSLLVKQKTKYDMLNAELVAPSGGFHGPIFLIEEKVLGDHMNDTKKHAHLLDLILGNYEAQRRRLLQSTNLLLFTIETLVHLESLTPLKRKFNE
jgi:hypothetical protein